MLFVYFKRMDIYILIGANKQKNKLYEVVRERIVLGVIAWRR